MSYSCKESRHQIIINNSSFGPLTVTMSVDTQFDLFNKSKVVKNVRE